MFGHPVEVRVVTRLAKEDFIYLVISKQPKCNFHCIHLYFSNAKSQKPYFDLTRFKSFSAVIGAANKAIHSAQLLTMYQRDSRT